VTPPVSARGAAPVWRGLEDRLYWIDQGLQRLWRMHVPSGRSEAMELPQTPAALVPCRRGGWLIALRDGIFHLPDWNLPLQRVIDAPYDTRRVCFVDGVCDPWGRLWLAACAETGDDPAATLYCLRTGERHRAELARIGPAAAACAGLAWSADGTLLYSADGVARIVYTQPMHTAGRWPPELGVRLPLRRLASPAPGGGEHPAGAAVDRAGRYWLALEGGARVVCLTAEGQIASEWPLPAQCPTGLCFGGPGLRTLFVTTARQHRPADELAQYPDSGAVLAHPLDAPGLPAPLYGD